MRRDSTVKRKYVEMIKENGSLLHQMFGHDLIWLFRLIDGLSFNIHCFYLNSKLFKQRWNIER